MMNYAETTRRSTDVPLSPVPSTVEKQEITSLPSPFELERYVLLCIGGNAVSEVSPVLMEGYFAARKAYADMEEQKVSQQILMLLANNWESFKEAKKAYEQDPSKFTGRPQLPRYKHKTEGRNILVYTVQAVSKRGLKKGLILSICSPIKRLLLAFR